MAVKMFAFARFEPPLWVVSDNPDPAEASSGDIVLDVAEDAPPQTDRPLLKTTVQALPSPNSNFNAYIARHDVVVRVRDAYGDPSSDELEDQCYVRPRPYNIFELRNSPGQVYTTMPLLQIKQMIRRLQETHRASGALPQLRDVDLRALEDALKTNGGMNVVIHGYDLANVLWLTPVSRLDIDANETAANLEAQQAKTRAENMRVLKLYVQAPNQMVSVWVGANGSVKFRNYPGDDNAMHVLEMIEPIIATCLQTV